MYRYFFLILILILVSTNASAEQTFVTPSGTLASITSEKCSSPTILALLTEAQVPPSVIQLFVNLRVRGQSGETMEACAIPLGNKYFVLDELGNTGYLTTKVLEI